MTGREPFALLLSSDHHAASGLVLLGQETTLRFDVERVFLGHSDRSLGCGHTKVLRLLEKIVTTPVSRHGLLDRSNLSTVTSTSNAIAAVADAPTARSHMGRSEEVPIGKTH